MKIKTWYTRSQLLAHEWIARKETSSMNKDE